MRWSQTLIPTLREVPKDAEIPSHQLLLRAGLIRPLAAGVYTFLPLGLRVLRKIEQVVREEMDAAGALEVLMPALHPREVWEQTGRATALNDILFKIKDRSDRPWLLGPTHEEIVTSLVAAEVRSYKQLPKNIYQIQTKFRDEARPRFGLIRVKEFIMKDAYSFDVDQAGLDRSYQTMYEAYKKIFARLGLKTLDVEAHSGAMGGNQSVEFMVVSPAGEDRIALCEKCGYAANLEKASSRVEEVRGQESEVRGQESEVRGQGAEGRGQESEVRGQGAEGRGQESEVRGQGAEGRTVEKFATPGVRTIDDLTKAPYNCAATDQIKTLIYVLDEQITLVLVRGCDELNEAKLPAVKSRPARPEEIKVALGALPGSLGAVGVSKLPVLADEALRGRKNMTTGANEDDQHLRGVDIERDIQVTKWVDVRTVQAGEGCPKCEGVLKIEAAIEIGHVFKLGTKYSATLGANFLDENGVAKPMIMGCYGIGVSRCVATLVEQCHDDRGIVWPRQVAPFEVAILPLNVNHPETMKVAGEINAGLEAAGISVIMDDRVDRPGVKFNDADLVGFPLRVTVGEKSLAKGGVEIKVRREAEAALVPVAEAVAAIKAKLAML